MFGSTYYARGNGEHEPGRKGKICCYCSGTFPVTVGRTGPEPDGLIDWKPAFDMAGWYEDQNKYKYNKSIKLYKLIIISVW